jgi:RNase P subunit RPR2
LSHFYLDEKSSSRAVCSRCSSLYIPGYNVTIEFVDQIPKGGDLVYKLNKNEKCRDFVLYTCRICLGKTLFSGRKWQEKSVKISKSSKKKSLLKNVLKQKLESKNDSQETGLNLLDFLKTI